MNEDHSGFSVVIPVRGHAPVFDTAIRSVARQIPPALEIIVVDDHSDSMSAGRLAEICGTLGVRMLLNEGRGRSAARNTGLARATGTHVVFLDADQEIPSGFFGRLGDWASRYDAVSLPEENMAVDFCSRALQAEYAIWFYGTHRDIPRVYRRDLVCRAGGYDEALEFGEDWDLAVRIRDLGATEGVMDGPPILHHARASWRQIGRKHFAYARFADHLRRKHGRRFYEMYRGWNPHVARNLVLELARRPGWTLAAAAMRAYKYAAAAAGWVCWRVSACCAKKALHR